MMTLERIVLCGVCLVICCILLSVDGSPWATPDMERLDELNDAKIYRAVVDSMNKWHLRQLEKERSHTRQKRQDPRVCYTELGCFDASGPFGYLDMLPATPSEISTKFFLFPGHRSRRSGSPPTEVPFNNLTDAWSWVKHGGFNSSLATKVIVHGFGSSCTHIWVYEMKSALMAVDEVNIVCVDWENGAVLPNYVKAAANTRLVGKQLAMLLKGLVEHGGISLSNMHLIGFSLGAHVAGFAGAELGNISRITGLDPAGPLFESQDPRARLDSTDAKFVDVIHSNGENLILGGLGSWQAMGHVDFYPNGGRMQKGCSNLFVGAVSDIIWSSNVEGRSLCNHRRAYKFFTDSVSPRCHFPAFPCESYEKFLAGKCFPCTSERKCGNMGYYADRSKGRGQLYLITRDEEPFCAHQYHVKIESSPSQVPVVSYGKIQITLIGDAYLNETFTMTTKDDEEMKLGDSFSRILVPHPILTQPNKIQIIYTAYSGWLSSGLALWRIDKVSLSDSFGKSSSVCKKDLVLESGVPVTLPLYPGECNIPKDSTDSNDAEERLFSQKNTTKSATTSTDKTLDQQSNFVPTPVVRIGNEILQSNDKKDNKNTLKNSVDIHFTLPWHPFKDLSGNEASGNALEKETESSRALNTRIVKMAPKDKAGEAGSTESLIPVKEIVEPILKPHSNKIARSHDLNRDKPEISEPILGPTTSRSFTTRAALSKLMDPLSLLSKFNQNQEIPYHFYEDESDWVPSVNPTTGSGEKWKRHDDSKSITIATDPPSTEEGLNLISMTVQFLPHRLARMFEQAEKYARETLLPLISAHTPKIITNFIMGPQQDRRGNKYLPLKYEEKTGPTTPSTLQEDIKNKMYSPPHINTELTEMDEEITTVVTSILNATNMIGNNGTNVVERATVLPLRYDNSTKVDVSTTSTSTSRFTSTSTSMPTSMSTSTPPPKKQSTEKIENASHKYQIEENVNNGRKLSTMEKEKNSRDIYINLPVFEENDKSIKYIPLLYPEVVKGENVK